MKTGSSFKVGGSRQISGAIFDVDGTLLDTQSLWENLAADYLRSWGIKPAPDLNDTVRNLSLEQAAAYLIRKYALAKTPEQVIRGVLDRIDDFYRREAQPKGGVKAFLNFLQQRQVPLVLATATTAELVEAALRRCGLWSYFRGMVTCSSAGGKDRPEIFEQARKILGTPKATTWVFEDSPVAVRTAKRAGFPAAAVYDATQKEAAPQLQLEADAYVVSLTEMEAYFAEKSIDHSRI